MAKDITLSRDNAEMLVDLLEAEYVNKCNGTAADLADQIRELFGMVTREREQEFIKDSQAFELNDKIYQLVKQEKIARRDKLIAEHGFEWRKHELPFTDAEMQAFEAQAIADLASKVA